MTFLDPEPGETCECGDEFTDEDPPVWDAVSSCFIHGGCGIDPEQPAVAKRLEDLTWFTKIAEQSERYLATVQVDQLSTWYRPYDPRTSRA